MSNDNARNIACPVLLHPQEARYTDEHTRQFQGCPTIAVTRGGRIYAGWYSGGICEPHIENFNLVTVSDDGGKSWSKPLLVIPSVAELGIHALDIQLWLAPDGSLHIYWVQNNAEPYADQPLEGQKVERDGWYFGDLAHAQWRIVCADPDAAEPVFSAPEYVAPGFMRCKPLALSVARWLCFGYDQLTDTYGYNVTADGGKTYTRHYGGKKIRSPYDETMAYRRADGSIRMLARTFGPVLAESFSYDDGRTWTDGAPTDIPDPSSRFFAAHTPTGRLLLVHHGVAEGHTRRALTVSLSADDGKTWLCRRLLDDRVGVSYPDADFYDGRIYLVWDFERTGAQEILFTSFTEEELLDESFVFPVSLISKP